MQRKKKPVRPRQKQPRQPGLEKEMQPRPEAWVKASAPEPKLSGRVAVISGGDSGIGRAVAFAFASEGAVWRFFILMNTAMRRKTVRAVERISRRVIALAGDIGDESFCQRAIARVLKDLGRIDIVVNNAAEQHPQDTLEKITARQLERTCRRSIQNVPLRVESKCTTLGMWLVKVFEWVLQGGRM